MNDKQLLKIDKKQIGKKTIRLLRDNTEKLSDR